MTNTIKYKGFNDGDWIIGDAVHLHNGRIEIIPFEEELPKYVDQNTICEFIGATDKDGNDVYEDDLIAVVKEWGECVRDWYGNWETERKRELLLFRVMRGNFGFFLDPVMGGDVNKSYGIRFATDNGKVVGNWNDDFDVAMLYDTLKKEMMEK